MIHNEIFKTIPEYYSEEEKETIIIILTQLANIYIDNILKESF